MAHSNPCGTHPHVANPSNPCPLPSTTTQAISQLKTRWHILPDFERAQALLPIIRAGVSRRVMAEVLNINEGTVRNVLLILEAGEADLASFRHGAISRNELIRRVRGTSQQRPAPDDGCEHGPTDLEPELMRNPAAVSREILHWLAADQLRASSASLILRKALERLGRAAEAGTHSRRDDLAEMSTEGIILSCCPAPDRSMLPASWCAMWLVIWVFQLIPDSAGCREALNIALGRVRTLINRADLW
jgi:hypothetical protein